MTAGLWLLGWAVGNTFLVIHGSFVDFFGMSAEDRVDLNKWGGVAMGIVGAILIAPQASKHVAKRWVGRPLVWIARAAQRLWNRLLRRDLTQVAAPSSIPPESKFSTPSVAQTPPWNEDATIEQKVQWLKDHVDHLDDVWQARAKRLDEIDQLTKQDLKVLNARVSEELEGIRKKIGEIERDSVMIDATGLLPIVAGLILTGIPEALASSGLWGWGVWFAGAAATIGAVIKSWRSEIWR